MPVDFNILDDDIAYAEAVLLKGDKQFNDQRRDFIKCLETLDLQAVPGSGKTTALLAKLIALNRQLPTRNGRGILVLSHTNAAVDEIKAKIEHYCPKLFAYPNFIGTIQSFVDAFLAVPYYEMCYLKKVVRIDNEIYRDSHHPDYSLKSFLDRKANGQTILLDYTLHEGDRLLLGTTQTAFPYRAHTTTYQKILAIKKEIRDRGILSFDDAYILANEYIAKFPGIVQILRQRFSCVFVDEMQDMERHQYDLIETLFNCEDVILQRIGDKNQAIYGNDSEVADFWTDRNVQEINGSHRLSEAIASIVQSLALRPIDIEGRGTNEDQTPINIKPHLIVYGDDSIDKVIGVYGSIIEQLIADNQLPNSGHNVYKAIGWTTAKPGDDAAKLKLNSFYPLFSKEQQTPRIFYDCLESYLFNFNGDKADFGSIRKNILNGILRVLRFDGITDNGRPFSKRTLVDHIRSESDKNYLSFKTLVYETCLLSIQRRSDEAHQKLVQLISLVHRVFARNAPGPSRQFIATRHVALQAGGAVKMPGDGNRLIHSDLVQIDIGTVHSIKGQTHTCTLYLESFYQTNVQGKGNYESTRLADMLLGGNLTEDSHAFIRQTMKMAYVGFSRPTHLLCFAVHKSRFNASLADLDRQVWEINDTLVTPIPAEDA